MGMIEDLLRQHGPDLMEQLTGRGAEAVAPGVEASDLEALIPATGQELDSAIGSGKLDLGSLLGGADIGELLQQLDIGSIANSAGVDTATAQQGLGALLPAILQLVKAQSGGAGALLDSLGGSNAEGLLGAAGKLAGGFFDKK